MKGVNFMNEKLKTIFLFLLSFIILGLIALISYLYEGENQSNEEISYAETTNSTSIVNKIFVDIKGAVKKPGVYEVNEGSIVNDVIKMAGGVKDNAYLKNINLSKKVSAEMVIYIYNKSEIKTTNSTTSIILNDVLYTTTNPIVVEKDNSSERTDKALININTASKSELMSLPGIGESKADLIIVYRNSTPFINIDDIKNVTGIGESLFGQIKNYITV